MTVQCVTCENFRLQGCDLARHGFGLCRRRPTWEAQSATMQRDCAQHQPAADPAMVSKRSDWIAAKEASMRKAVEQPAGSRNEA